MEKKSPRKIIIGSIMRLYEWRLHYMGAAIKSNTRSYYGFTMAKGEKRAIVRENSDNIRPNAQPFNEHRVCNRNEKKIFKNSTAVLALEKQVFL